MKFLSFSEAKAQGKTRYYTGKECPRGHVAERIVSTRACTACCAEKKRQWLQENPDKANAQKRAYRDANLEKVKAWKLANQKLHRESANKRNQRYAEANRELLRIKNAAWAKANPGKVTAKAARYRATKLQQTPPWSDLDLIEDIYTLAAIYRDFGHDVEVDHIVPLQGKKVRGLHVPANLQVIPSVLNKSKSNGFATI